LVAVQIIYQVDLSGGTVEEAIQQFKEWHRREVFGKASQSEGAATIPPNEAAFTTTNATTVTSAGEAAFTASGAVVTTAETTESTTADAASSSPPLPPKKRAYINVEFTSQLSKGMLNSREEVNTLLKAHVSAELDRIPLVLRNILELAIYELLFESTPAPVVINEYVEICKDFFDENEQAFVNGVLDSIRQKISNKKKCPEP
jgi:transcription antitermination factor NusB